MAQKWYRHVVEAKGSFDASIMTNYARAMQGEEGSSRTNK
jgi:hypothetical protein